MSRRKEANDAARRIIARLSIEPEAAQMVVDGNLGYRIMPEEVWIEKFGQWVRLSDMTISGGPSGYLYPGPILKWRLRRLFAWWRDQVELPPTCGHPRQTDVHWTQDGYVSMCKVCKRPVYHGD